MRRWLIFIAGFISLTLGVIGIFLPILPTTPFLLLSAGCFFRSSDKFYRWITEHRIFGKYIKNYLKYHAITRHAKITALIFLWGVLSISIIIFPVLWLRLLLAAVGVGVSIHILSMNTLTDEMSKDEEE